MIERSDGTCSREVSLIERGLSNPRSTPRKLKVGLFLGACMEKLCMNLLFRPSNWNDIVRRSYMMLHSLAMTLPMIMIGL
jgi:hypothetical protein